MLRIQKKQKWKLIAGLCLLLLLALLPDCTCEKQVIEKCKNAQSKGHCEECCEGEGYWAHSFSNVGDGPRCACYK